ncbi:probable WRKY transcription factor 20 isoform X2 [Rhodamnia argentea]|uniref:Probable WRKY transcription factor 20 isoform X2 n=1 Tax=Rhodamnia argentea TaxID=178133 RepID=A0A8B8NUG1_9MYRT|nr:probable WRKY transcription factor 20 isoform X2 [Rhodamnia argentea]
MEPSPSSLDSEAPRRSSDAATGRGPTGSFRNSGSHAPGGCGARYKLMSPAKLPISRSACISIPPGLSPSSFLESPVLLSNPKVEPSPTTGSFAERRMLHGSISSTTSLTDNHPSYPDRFNKKESGFFEFQPSPRPNLGTAEVNHQNKESMQVHSHSQTRSLALVPFVRSELAVSSSELSLSTPTKLVPSGANPPDEVDSEESNQQDHPGTGIQAKQSEHKGSVPSVMAERLSDDGYNWRKYGQKHVKGSVFPRSYYKCTHPNCEVKKLFERSPDGHITEIIYKGVHDHPKPEPNRRVTGGIMMHIQGERSANASPLTGETSSNIYYQTSNVIGPKSTAQLSLAAGNEDCVEGAASLQYRICDEVDEDDPLSKRRRMDIGRLDVTPLIKPIREPRVVVQTLSEVDILDDGYRWRKYGQKVVRGNPNPRSYYKCTNAGCPVRKHVERASNDKKAVITTYEGKHNHDVPTARASSHDMAALTAPAGTSRVGTKEGETISLDLGVGISSAAEAGYPKPQGLRHTIHKQLVQNQIHLNNSNMKVLRATPVSSFYCADNCGATNYCSSTEDLRRSRGVDIPPLNHSYSYPQTVARLLTGPYNCLPQNQSK